MFEVVNLFEYLRSGEIKDGVFELKLLKQCLNSTYESYPLVLEQEQLSFGRKVKCRRLQVFQVVLP